jgi:hypothetical protein
MAGPKTTSFKDPAYSDIERKVEAEVGLPRGMLSTIRTRGERSNANQVSEAGARSVYQIIPATRASIRKNYGFDPYAGPEQAARGAAVLLKESLDRNDGSHAAAFAEYHGGTDRSQWGRRTKAYIQRTTGSAGALPEDRPSTYDRVKGRQQGSSGPSLDDLFRARMKAGKPGGMTPQDAASFDAARAHGQIVGEPAWFKAPAAPREVPELPLELLKAYNSHVMDDDPEARAAIEKSIASGDVRLPTGQKLLKPAARSLGDKAAMALTSAARGAADVADMFTGPDNPFSAVSPIMGLLPRGAGNMAVDALSADLPKPESASEKLTSGIVRGAVGGAALGPISGVGRGAARMLGEVGVNAMSGAVAGGAQETARQAGAGPVGQLAAGLIGGAAPMGALAAAERLVTRTPRTLVEAVHGTPREVAIDRSGNLTPEGQEIAARHGASHEDVTQAFDRTPDTAQVPPVDVTPTRVSDSTGIDPAPTESTPSTASPRPATAIDDAPAMQTVRRHQGTDYPVEVIERGVVDGEGAVWARVRGTGSDDVGYVPDAEIVEVPAAPDRTTSAPPSSGPASSESAPTPGNADASAPANPAAARVSQANEFGFDLTRGQATKDFGTQVEEQNLRKVATPEGEALRQWDAQNAAKIKTATDNFAAAFGEQASDEARGTQLREALQDLHSAGRRGVTALYDRARDLPGSDTPLPHNRILDAADNLILETPMEQGSKDALERTLAKFGVLGDKVETNGRYSSIVTDDGRRIRVLGNVEPLTLANAEDFRQALNGAYDKGTGLMSRAIKALDDTVDEAIQGLADGSPRTAAYKTARSASSEVKRTFEDKDVVADIIGWKNGTRTAKLSPETVVERAFSKASDLRRIKAVLLSRATPESTAMWRGLQAHGVARVFSRSMTENNNTAGQVAQVVSGAKLRSTIKTFGPDKLKILLDGEDFNSLMRLQRSIEDATIPIGGTVPQGSAPWWQRMIGNVDNKVTAAFAAAGTAVGGPIGTAIGGGIGRAVGGAVKSSADDRAAAETLRNATSYTPERAATDSNQPAPSAASRAAEAARKAGAVTLRAFIDTYSSPRVLSPLLASTSPEKE